MKEIVSFMPLLHLCLTALFGCSSASYETDITQEKEISPYYRVEYVGKTE